MSRIREILGGTVYVELVCADPGETLSSYVAKGFGIKEPVLAEPLVLRFWLSEAQWEELEKMAEKRGEMCRRLKSRGGISAVKRLKKRLPLCVALLLMVAFALYAPQRIWFFRVEGNEKVPDGEILAAAQECGLTFWEKVDEVNSQQFKNRILNEVPQLQWAGVNFSGGIVTISVRERLEGEEIRQTDEVTDVVASRDGIVVSMSVLGGQSLCRPGQAVTKGETLVTGCVEHEYQTQYTCADAEVYALTQRQIQAVFPREWVEKDYDGQKSLSVYMIFGRNKIKIFGNSGISGITCDKMKKVMTLTLPGGYSLPFSLVVEESRSFQPASMDAQGQAEEVMLQFLDHYVSQDMVAGEILDRELEFCENEGVYELNAVYSCREMIARQKKVLLFEGEDTNDRTNRERGESGGFD